VHRAEHRTQQPSASKYAVIAAEQPVVNQGDPNDAKWIGAGGDPGDRGRFVEMISGRLNGSERMLVGIAWLEPGDVHLLHPHPHADDWYYVIEGSALFTVSDGVIRGGPGTALFLPAGVPHRIENDGGERLHFAWGFDRPEFEDAGIVWDE
jgi:oxalate decarboxylase/phosphoglucose isomerase-like protein (cupin superfamily)